ncbi:MAG TPA: DMT family transporter, partial [Ilumatobacteraceae bacterium]|nr:DMT family transporter [Ilumatobacteraceae bacterium]
MATATPSHTLPRKRPLGTLALGALAVGGVVIGFSLSSTLVKRAETPGVLVAFWRLTVATIVWNLYVRCTGRRVTIRDLRQALVPGAFFGLNLAIFFAGATKNSVANAALIGSLAPFFIVPIGAKLFKEFNDSRALVFAIVAFAGVGIVLFSAPAKGDATLGGNMFGLIAMLLLVGYVVSTRRFRHDMDVAIFMAAICPVGALAVLPLAVVNGGVFGMSGTGWTYMLILTLISGVVANGLLVYAQRAIQIGTISVAQVVQPAIAVLWSVLLLDETVSGWQIAGIATSVAGLAVFVAI